MDFTLEEICASWDRRSYDNAKALIRWSSDAARYGAKELPAMETSLCLQMVSGLGGGTGLDVGCGGGQYSIALEKLGYAMHGTDFSPDMIAQAEKNREAAGSRALFSVEDWHTVDLRQRGWEGRFDLVLAHMTPAVISGKTFLKLIRASRGWVFLQKPVRRHSSLQDALCEHLGLDPESVREDRTFAQAFSMAWLLGYSPRTAFRNTVWHSELPIAEAAAAYQSRLGGQQEDIEEFFRMRFPQGTVIDTTDTQLAAMLFHI